MRTLVICAAGFAIAAAVLGACSDGSGQLPGTGGSGTTDPTPMAGTMAGPSAGTSPVATAGTSAGGSGNVPTAGTAATVGGTGSAPPIGGTGTGGTPTGGTGTGGGPTGGTGTGGGGATDPYSGPFKILVLHTTLDFPHDSIPICSLMVGIEGAFSFENGKKTGANLRTFVEGESGKQAPNLGVTPDAMMPAGTKPGSQWTAELATDDLAQFTDENLKKYALIFSCNPTGTVFSANSKVANKAAAMAAFTKFVENGGGWAGVHSATDFEKSNGFPWFVNTLAGATFQSHTTFDGTVQAQSAFLTHPVLKGIPATWSVRDEWYVMNRDVSAQPGFKVLQKLTSDNRNVTWVKEVGTNGRSFYTIRGHAKDVYEEPDFRKLVLNGILWATHRLE